MKINHPVTDYEVAYDKNLNILSTTDAKGSITYVNPDFIKISGFESSELIGRNHNIVRHPDMPPAAFGDLWSTVQTGRSWMGIVKNRCQNGDHYWVDAYVTPIRRDGKIAEYQSVRRKPDPDYVKRAEKIYPQLLQNKRPRHIIKTPSLQTRILLSTYLPLLFSLAISAFFFELPSTLLTIFTAALLISTALTCIFFSPLRQLSRQARETVINPVAQYIYTGRTDDIGQIQLAIKMLRAESSALVGRISDSANTLTQGSSELSSAVNQSEVGVRQQFAETDQVAAAVNQMSASIQEVAANAQNSSDSAANSLLEVSQGKRVVNESMLSIQDLKENIEQAVTVIADVEASSKNINSILDVIGGIAEQTNLLALNAAIEAARAGDAGRGFAVVADEVRLLANRTQTSTEEIREMIEKLQDSAGKAVLTMGQGQIKTDTCVSQNEVTVKALDAIYSAIEQISNMNTQIAVAVEQQGVVADEINRSIFKIRDMSEQNLSAVEQTAVTSGQMFSVSQGFSELSSQFWARQ
ncbi:MAG: methyl-accepting chemotaxis protein [Oceanospirillales bacterium]|nr:methyl-accepting chemotaxis protein [Oceanospirillales bacterium]MBR9889349.1 methyl-accepting chemotaxis protein [Oceanospirillales bacterium]